MHAYASLVREQFAKNNNYKRIISAHPHQRKESPAHIVLIADPLNNSYSLEIAFDVNGIRNIIGGVYVSKPFYALHHLFKLFRSTYECLTPYIFRGDPIEMLILMQRGTEKYRA